MILHRYYDQKITVTIDAPDARTIKQKAIELLDKKTEDLVTLDMAVGMAQKHPSDRFNRSVGRSLSAERLKSITFKVESAKIYSAKYSSLISLVLISEENQLAFVLTAHSNDKTHVRFDFLS